MDEQLRKFLLLKYFHIVAFSFFASFLVEVPLISYMLFIPFPLSIFFYYLKSFVQGVKQKHFLYTSNILFNGHVKFAYSLEKEPVMYFIAMNVCLITMLLLIYFMWLFCPDI